MPKIKRKNYELEKKIIKKLREFDNYLNKSLSIFNSL